MLKNVGVGFSFETPVDVLFNKKATIYEHTSEKDKFKRFWGFRCITNVHVWFL